MSLLAADLFLEHSAWLICPKCVRGLDDEGYLFNIRFDLFAWSLNDIVSSTTF